MTPRMTNISHALATAVIETAEQDGCRFRWESVFQWEAAANRVRIEALDDPTGRLQGAIAAAAAIDAESCVDCRGPGRPHRGHPDGPVRTRCPECAAPWEVPARATWTVPADAIMTPAEAAAGGWTEPATCKRLRCFGWSVEDAAELLNDKATCAIDHKHGWNHLVRALLRLTLASQEPEPWTVHGLKEKWGRLIARCKPGTAWRHGAATPVLHRERQDLLALRAPGHDAEPLRRGLRRTAAVRLLRDPVPGRRQDARRSL